MFRAPPPPPARGASCGARPQALTSELLAAERVAEKLRAESQSLRAQLAGPRPRPRSLCEAGQGS